MTDAIFSQIDFGPLKEFLDEDNITDISYSNGGQVWLKTLDKGVYKVERPEINNPFMEKLAFQCSNVMGKTFNMAHPFLDSESAELRMNFVHDSIATNGIAVLIRKTPAKIRLNRDKLLDEEYLTEKLHEFLFKCVEGHCNIIVAGETGSGKTELVKYLASHTKEDEKVISIEDTLELHLDRIFPHRDIVAMKTNNIASYSDVLVTCMRQNPRWILLSEVRSAEAVMAVRNSISSGHNILSTIHADKASSIPMRMYSLLESNQEIDQFLNSIHRYVQIGVYVKGYMSKIHNRFQREIVEVCEFFVSDETNEPKANIIYKKTMDGMVSYNEPSQKLLDYLSIQGVELGKEFFGMEEEDTRAGKTYEETSEEDSEASETTPVVNPIEENSSTANPVTPDASVVNTPPVVNVEPAVSVAQPTVVPQQQVQQAQVVSEVAQTVAPQQPINSTPVGQTNTGDSMNATVISSGSNDMEVL